MKKQYKTPETNVFSVESDSMLAVSPGITISNKREDDVVMGESKGYRGEWGNLWK